MTRFQRWREEVAAAGVRYPDAMVLATVDDGGVPDARTVLLAGVDQEGLRYALVVHAGFRLKGSSVTGYLIIVLSVGSVDRLMRAVDAWESTRNWPRDPTPRWCSAGTWPAARCG